MKMIKFTLAAIFVAGLAFGALAQGKTQNPKPAQMLQSFCGFKAGEDKKAAKKPSKFHGYEHVGIIYHSRKPFHKFNEVLLEYADTDNLVMITALSINKKNLAAARKELDACCKELSKYGIRFDEKWNDLNEAVFEKHGSGRGVPEIVATGQVDPNNPNGSLMSITVLWDLRYFLQPQLKVKPAKYNPKSELSKKEFVENVFGLKFGENIFDTIKRGPLDFQDSDALASRILSAPVCGIDEVQLFQGEEKKLNLISLVSSSVSAPKEKDEASAKTKCAKSLASIAGWLALAPTDFETTEKTMDSERGVPSTDTTVESVYFKDGFQIEIRCGWSKIKDSGDILLTSPCIYFRTLAK